MTLADRQAELVRSLVAGEPDPDGFDEARLDAARKALLRKRAGEVRKMWPRLAASYGHDWVPRFSQWAAGRRPQGAFRDGWEFCREHPPEGAAAIEYLVHDMRMRRSFGIRASHGVVVFKLIRRVRVIPLPAWISGWRGGSTS